MYKCFKKVRISGNGKGKPSEADVLMKAKQDLRQKLAEMSDSGEIYEQNIKLKTKYKNYVLKKRRGYSKSTLVNFLMKGKVCAG